MFHLLNSHEKELWKNSSRYRSYSLLHVRRSTGIPKVLNSTDNKNNKNYLNLLDN